MIISLEQYFAQEACLRSSQQLEILLFLFCLKCHSATLKSKGTWRGHSQSPMLKVMRNSSALLIITRKGSFHHCPPTEFSSWCICAVVAAPPRAAPRGLFCSVLPVFFLGVPFSCADSEGEGSTRVPSGFAGPWETSCRAMRDSFNFPHSTALSLKLQWPVLLTFGIRIGAQHVSSCTYEELKSKECVSARYLILYQSADQV